MKLYSKIFIALWLMSALQGGAFAAEMKQSVPTTTSDSSAEFWQAIKDSTQYKDFDNFLIVFPDSHYAELAQMKLGGGKWITDTNKGCKVFDQSPQTVETVSWSGDCLNGRADGKGRLEWRFGDVLQKTETTLEQGRGSGQFRMEIYKAGALIGTIDGMGSYSPDGMYSATINERFLDEKTPAISFEGTRVRENNRNHEKGTLTLRNGDIYTGELVNMAFHGTGYLKKENGDFFKGVFDNGSLITGSARMTFKDDAIYEGGIKDGKQCGSGTLTHPTGYRYEGDFQNGVRTGKAKIKFADGNRYTGDVVDGKPHGMGTVLFPNGRSITAKFINGTPDKSTVISSTDAPSPPDNGASVAGHDNAR